MRLQRTGQHRGASMTATRMRDAFVVAGIQLELEEQARATGVTVIGVAHTAKTTYSTR